MKKLLGIVVLGLLLSGNAYANQMDAKFQDDNHIFGKLPKKLISDKSAKQNPKRLEYAKDYCAKLRKK
jgi:hypothetical protein